MACKHVVSRAHLSIVVEGLAPKNLSSKQQKKLHPKCRFHDIPTHSPFNVGFQHDFDILQSEVFCAKRPPMFIRTQAYH